MDEIAALSRWQTMLPHPQNQRTKSARTSTTTSKLTTHANVASFFLLMLWIIILDFFRNLKAALSAKQRHNFTREDSISVTCSLPNQFVLVSNERYTGPGSNCHKRNDMNTRASCSGLVSACQISIANVIDATKGVYDTCRLDQLDIHYTCAKLYFMIDFCIIIFLTVSFFIPFKSKLNRFNNLAYVSYLIK